MINLALSKMTFHRILKNVSNFATAVSYSLRSSPVTFVDVSTDSPLKLMFILDKTNELLLVLPLSPGKSHWVLPDSGDETTSHNVHIQPLALSSHHQVSDKQFISLTTSLAYNGKARQVGVLQGRDQVLPNCLMIKLNQAWV